MEIKRSNKRKYEERTSQCKMAYFKVNEIKLHMDLTGKSFQDKHPDLQANEALRQGKVGEIMRISVSLRPRFLVFFLSLCFYLSLAVGWSPTVYDFCSLKSSVPHLVKKAHTMTVGCPVFAFSPYLELHFNFF